MKQTLKNQICTKCKKGFIPSYENQRTCNKCKIKTVKKSIANSPIRSKLHGLQEDINYMQKVVDRYNKLIEIKKIQYNNYLLLMQEGDNI